MFGATESAAPVTRSVDVGTAEAVATSAASPVPRCADRPSPGCSRRETTAAASSAPASATELVLFFLDDDGGNLPAIRAGAAPRALAMGGAPPVLRAAERGGSAAAEPWPLDAPDTRLGMVRAFHYAAATSLLALRREDHPRADPWGWIWQSCASGAFVRG